MRYKTLLDHYPIISDQITRSRLTVVLRELEATLEQGINGDIAEFGCYIGTTSVFISRLLNATANDKRFYVYDSFAGLPDKSTLDLSAAGTQFKSGELTVSKHDFLQTFRRANVDPPITHKAWFKDIQPKQLPEHLSYAFLDGDFYSSIMDSLKLVWPRLEFGGVVTIDDYQRVALPGVTAAVHDYFSGIPTTLRHEQNVAIIKKS